MLLDTRARQLPTDGLDVGRDVNRCELFELKSIVLAPAVEASHRSGVCRSRVWVPNLRGKELNQTTRRFLTGTSEQRRDRERDIRTSGKNEERGRISLRTIPRLVQDEIDHVMAQAKPDWVMKDAVMGPLKVHLPMLEYDNDAVRAANLRMWT